MDQTSRKRRITFGPEQFQLSRDTAFRRTEPDRSLDRAILQVLDGKGIGPNSDPLRAGVRVGKYELIRELGRGAMGRVFLARDTKLGRRVAIKFLNADHLGDRFMVEARTTAKCAHENIVVIHDVSEHEGRPYMVLEYLEGQTLRELLGRPLSAHRAVELVIPVVRAMVQAHSAGIVHRDLKPDNIFVTSSGTIKVLDFGIAKLLNRRTVGIDKRSAPLPLGLEDTAITRDGVILGTMPYMSPEQWQVRDRSDGSDLDVDHRSDIWAVGIILYEMLCGRHPLAPLSRERLAVVSDLSVPMPSLPVRVPRDLARIIDVCLEKHKHERLDSANDLLTRLQALVHHDRRLGEGESPFAGLAPFQEQDAHRFFGRARDIARLVARIDRQPLLSLVGPTGVGKSSLIRAGVVPALKRSGEPWEVFTLRPGRYPLAGLANLVDSIMEPLSADTSGVQVGDVTAHLRREPGYLGVLLRNRARQKNSRVLVFVDQFEELYTLVDKADDRRVFLACLVAMADDSDAPLRVVLSMRSDFLERVAEDREFMDVLAGALSFLSAPERDALETALVQPTEMAGYSFEAPQMVERMLDALDRSQAALPLLQFTATKLWEARDRERRLLTTRSYEEMGGVAGALASHADDVVAGMSNQARKLTRAIFERLVTPERTRAIASVDDLCQLSNEPDRARALIDHLVRSRLLVANKSSFDHAAGQGPTVEIVHESLIDGWPTLRRWLEEDADKAKFVAQVRVAAKQWQQNGRPVGLLWRGKAMLTRARDWSDKLDGDLTGVEADYLEAVLSLANRSTRTRRLILAATLSILIAMVAAAVVALIWINNAERMASLEALKAQQEAIRARNAEASLNEKVKELETAQQKLLVVQKDLLQKTQLLETSKGDLEQAIERLRKSVSESERAKQAAEEQSGRAQEAARVAERERARAAESATAERDALEKFKKAQKRESLRRQRIKETVGPYTTHLP